MMSVISGQETTKYSCRKHRNLYALYKEIGIAHFFLFSVKILVINSISLFAFQGHIAECDHTSITCVHTQCTAEVKRCLLAKHLEEECLYRTIQCENCQETLNFVSLKAGFKMPD